MTQVLVVDDVAAMAEQYAYDLKRVGKFDTLVAAGGEEALDMLAREPIDCVVLDLEMPGTDGFEVARRLTADRTLRRHPRIIAITGHSGEDYRSRSLAAGCEQHLVKPVDSETLLRLLE